MTKDTAVAPTDRRREAIKTVAAHVHDSLRMQSKMQKFCESY